MFFFLISSTVLGLLDQLQIFWQLYLMELLEFLIDSGATRAVALDISKAFDRVWHAGLLRKLASYGIWGQEVFGLISSFLSNRQLRVVLDGKFSQKYQLMLEFLRVLLLVLHFSYYILMTFLMMLSEVLLSMLMVLLSTLSVIRHLICGNNYNWLLNLNLI